MNSKVVHKECRGKKILADLIGISVAFTFKIEYLQYIFVFKELALELIFFKSKHMLRLQQLSVDKNSVRI